MAINTSVYGTSEQWLNCYFQPNTIAESERNKKANFGSNNATLGQGVSSGRLSYSEPIDKSLSYCGLGAESALSHIAYLKNGASDINSYQDRFVTNFAFFERTATDYIFPPASYRLDSLNEYAWQSNQASYANLSPSLEPYTKVNPKNIVLVIYVKAYNTTYTAEVTKPLKEYLTSYTVSHPYISRVFVTPYFGRVNSGADTRTVYTATGNRIPFIIGLLDEYDFTTENKKFYLYASENLSIFGIFHSNYEIPEYCYGIIAHTENSKTHFKISQSGSITRFAIEYYPEFESDILKTAACFGLYFTTVAEVARTGLLTNPDMYIGLLDENGIGHGNYLRGADTANAPQNNYTDMNQSGYDYTKDVDKSKYNNGTNFNLWDFSLNTINKFYVLSETQVEQLSTELYTIMSSVSSDMPIERYNQTVFLTQNPIDCIVSIKRFPVDVPYIGTTTPLKLGSQTTNISAHYLLKPCNVYYFSFSNSSDTGLYKTFGGSFLDYEPYTKVSINVPFCGSFDVPCNYFHKYGGVDIALLIDFVTGACTAFLMVNGNVVDSLQGECGVNVPLSGLQTATIDSQIFNASMSKQKQDNNFALSMLGGAAAIGIGVATGGAAAIVGGAAAMIGGVLNKDINDKSINYDLQHMQAPIKQVSSASPVIARANDMRCKMIISRPEYMDNYSETVYAETIGFACLLNGYVSDFSGFTVGKINLDGINAPKEVKEMISNAFASGVYL